MEELWKPKGLQEGSGLQSLLCPLTPARGYPQSVGGWLGCSGPRGQRVCVGSGTGMIRPSSCASNTTPAAASQIWLPGPVPALPPWSPVSHPHLELGSHCRPTLFCLLKTRGMSSEEALANTSSKPSLLAQDAGQPLCHLGSCTQGPRSPRSPCRGAQDLGGKGPQPPATGEAEEQPLSAGCML